MSTRGSLGGDIGRLGKVSEGLEGSLGKIGSAASSIGSSLAGAFTGAVEKAGQIAETLGKIGGGAMAGAVAYGVRLNSELEKTQISLSGIFEAQLGGGLANNFRKAGDVMATMRKDAAELPGEFKDLVNIFRFSATPGFQAGASVEQLEKLSAKAMAASAALGVPMEQAAREMGMLLQGRAGAHNVLGNLLGLTGDKATEFNKGSGADRLKTLETEFNKYGALNEVFAGSFDALSSTLVDNTKRFLGVATSGVFERVKIALKDANGWFDKNQATVLGFADKVSLKLEYAFDVAREKITEWWPVMRTFAENAEEKLVAIWAKVEPILEKLEPRVKRMFSDPALFDHLESVLKAYGAVKIGQAVLPGAGALIKGVGSLGGAEGAVGGLGAIGSAAGVLVPALIALAAGTYGVFDILTDSSNKYHDGAVESVGNIKANMEKLGPTTDNLTDALKKGADALGAFWLKGAEFWSGVAVQADSLGNSFMRLEQKVLSLVGISFGLNNKDEPTGYVPPPFEIQPRMWANAMADEQEKRDAKTKRGAGGGGGGTHIAKVEITIAETTDPNRLARLTIEELKKLSERATRSPISTNPMRRGII